ncbi:MAG: hypothetical protein DKT66_27125 [Candidatus Melainabacteria bacterium]|nr:MAG: hypothetical protein DKT66_27125 [Candidatus Melainabacteria bacterium]
MSDIFRQNLGANVMTTVASRERDTIEIEPLPEYTREEPGFKKDVSNAMPSLNPSANITSSGSFERWERSPIVETEEQHSDVLEALWPGVHHDFERTASTSKRGPSFYLTIGFMGGAIMSMLGVWGFTTVSSVVANAGSGSQNKIVMAQGQQAGQQTGAPQASAPAAAGGDVIIPLASTYEVQSGDTLAVIALRNYKHASPRLLDEICRANGMRNANVLSLGQKITLPEYHRVNSQVAATTSNPIQ